MKQTHSSRNQSFRIVQPPKDKDGIKIVLSPEGDDTIFFHVSIQLAEGIVGTRLRRDEPEPALVHDIMGINGVQHMYVDKYKVKVSRTLAVDWEDIVPRAVVAIRESAKIVLAAQKQAVK